MGALVSMSRCFLQAGVQEASMLVRRLKLNYTEL